MARLTNLQRITGVGFLASALFSAVISVVSLNEGYSEKAYQDSAGVWTICYGETAGVKPSETRSKAGCDTQLRASLGVHAEALAGLPEGLPDVVLLGAVDAAYNIGVQGFQNSGMYRALMNRDYKAAGESMLKWKYITVNGRKFDCSTPGNKVCYGLWKRRQWQAMALSNSFPTPQAAVKALPR